MTFLPKNTCIMMYHYKKILPCSWYCVLWYIYIIFSVSDFIYLRLCSYELNAPLSLSFAIIPFLSLSTYIITLFGKQHVMSDDIVWVCVCLCVHMQSSCTEMHFKCGYVGLLPQRSFQEPHLLPWYQLARSSHWSPRAVST